MKRQLSVWLRLLWGVVGTFAFRGGTGAWEPTPEAVSRVCHGADTKLRPLVGALGVARGFAFFSVSGCWMGLRGAFRPMCEKPMSRDALLCTHLSRRLRAPYARSLS